MTDHRANARKTHCPKGHPYDEANTLVHRETGWRQCRECQRVSNARFDRRSWKLKKLHGMTRQEFTDLLVSQDGLCAICYDVPATQLDHDHVTGRVRGVLCGRCNRALGMLDDDPERLRDAANYLTEVA